MSDEINPTTRTDLESAVNPQAEDNSISEDRIQGADLDSIDQSNIVEGERSNKGGVSNYAEADAKADQAVESTAGIDVPDVNEEAA